MRIGMATYRALTVLTILLFVVAVAFVTLGQWIETVSALTAMVAVVIGQAVLLGCPHCGARPGVWILVIWTLLVDPYLYVADALLLRRCPRCAKSVSGTETRSA